MDTDGDIISETDTSLQEGTDKREQPNANDITETINHNGKLPNRQGGNEDTIIKFVEDTKFRYGGWNPSIACSKEGLFLSKWDPETVIMMNLNGSVISELSLQCWPHGLCVKGDHLYVTLPDASSIKVYTYIAQSLVEVKTIRAGGWCQGIDSFKDNLVVAYAKDVRVRMLRDSGTVLSESKYTFNGPIDIVGMSSTNSIFISVEQDHAVFVMAADLVTVLNRVTHPDIMSPRGMCVYLNRVLVTSWGRHCVVALTKRGEYFKTVLQRGNGISNPASISYEQEKKQLFVADHWDKIHIFNTGEI